MSPFLRPFLNIVIFSDGLRLLDKLAKHGIPLEFHRIFESTTSDDHSLISIYLFLVMDTIIYLTLYYYFSEIFPGPYGTSKSFLFPFHRSFWKRSQSSYSAGGGQQSDKVVVRIQNLTKEYRQSVFCASTVVAVRNLSMEIRRNRMTVLLGHNGSGKTSLLSIICGRIARTSGSIVVDGVERIEAYRHLIGYYSKDNILLYPYFTIKEHLLFYGGVSIY